MYSTRDQSSGVWGVEYVLEGLLESGLLIMCTTIPVFGNFFPCCTRRKESKRVRKRTEREQESEFLTLVFI